jgi:hypothetical protein
LSTQCAPDPELLGRINKKERRDFQVTGARPRAGVGQKKQLMHTLALPG